MPRRSPRRSYRARLKWTLSAPLDAFGNAPSWSIGDRDERYEIDGIGPSNWRAFVRYPDGAMTVLVAGVGFGKAYQACIRHYYGPLESLH